MKDSESDKQIKQSVFLGIHIYKVHCKCHIETIRIHFNIRSVISSGLIALNFTFGCIF